MQDFAAALSPCLPSSGARGSRHTIGMERADTPDVRVVLDVLDVLVFGVGWAHTGGMSPNLTFTEARSNLREVFETAGRGRVVTVKRGSGAVALTDAERLRAYFLATTTPGLRLQFEDGVWVASMDCRPFVSEGATADEAIDDLVESLREYAEDWEDHLSQAPNHSTAWALVQLVNLSDDEGLRTWLRSTGD